MSSTKKFIRLYFFLLPFALQLLPLALCLMPFSLIAQDSIKKPKIGLVLSGGGAKAFAQVGVLKVLESAGIKIDFIGGTSMGAVIGGLYASGYNATQVDSIIQTTNFDNVLVDFIPRTAKTFYEKRNDEMYALVLPFNKFKIGAPQALSKGMFNYNLFNQLTYHVRHINNFNQLPTPFLCMATDIEKGEQVIINKGILAQGMFASASIPSVYTPVILQGKVLVDGGVINNYPIEEIRKLGADIIIGIDVQNGLKTKDELTDASKILFQLTNLQMAKKMELEAANTEIYVKPDVMEYGIVSFEKAIEIIQRGEDATFLVFDKLKELTKNLPPYYKPKIEVKNDSIQLASIHLKSLKDYSRSYILGKLKFKENQKISFKQLEQGMQNINATRNFGVVTYTFNRNGAADDLEFNFTENPTKTYLKFGLHYDGLFKSAVLINLTNKKNIFKNDIASFDFILGDNLRYNFDYYVDNGYNLSFGFKSNFNQFNKNITTSISTRPQSELGDISTLNIDYIDLTNQLYLQSIFMQKFLVGSGIEFKHLNIQSQTLVNSNPVLDKSYYTSVFGYLKYDSFDSQYFPKKGWSFSSDIHNYLFSSDFNKNFKPFSIAKADAAIAFKTSPKASFKIQAETGLIIGNDSVSVFDFILGGYGFNPVNNMRPFYGYDFLTLTGNSYLKVAGTFDYEFYKKNHLNFSANFANIKDGYFDSLEWFSLPQYSGYALGYGLETIIGPLEIKQSWSPERKKGYTWFSIGFCF